MFTQLKTINLNPFIGILDDFVDADFCDHVVEQSRSELTRASVVDPKGGDQISDARTNSTTALDTWADSQLTAYAQRISEILRLPPENSEPASVLHYVEDQEFHPHQDAFAMNTGGREQRARGGQRLFTTICYLNDVKDGGATEFPDLKISIKAKQGRVLIFGNTLLGTAEPHPQSTHAGRPCNGSEKWALTMWWRQLTYQVHRTYPPETGDLTEY